MSWKRLVCAFSLVLGSVVVLEACGPDFEPDIFVPAHRPVVPQDFAKSELGVLQPGYFIAEKVVAFRYLSGGTLDQEEQRQLKPVAAPGVGYDDTSDAAWQAAANAPTTQDRWKTARAAYGSGVQVARVDPDSYPAADTGWISRIVNCSDSALDTATETLAARSAKWGQTSAALKDWIAGQDAVFSNCSGEGHMPGAVPANAPVLLKQDRSYQVAAATFYRGDYLAARDAFLALAKDQASPWSRWGLYLAARSVVRQAGKAAADKANAEQAQFEPAGMQTARDMLQQAESSPDAKVKHAAEAELNFVMIRLEPVKQASTLARSLAGPGHDPEFGQHLVDLRFLLDHGSYGDAPLLRWMTLTGSPLAYSMAPSIPASKGAALAGPIAEEEWERHPDLPGLVAALMCAKTGNPKLLQAAAAVPESSPAYVTVAFHRARLLVEAKDLQSAREITSHVLEITRRRNELAATNALLEVRLKTAGDLTALLQDAPRTMISPESESAAEAGCSSREEATCKSRISATQFDEDAATLFNASMPLSLWIDAARDEALPGHLRATLALSGWLRALVLQRDDEAKALMPLLPPPVQTSLGKSDDPTGFAATLVLLHSPGLRPFVDAGVQRAATYTQTDNFRNNLWCSTMEQAVPPDYGHTNAPVLPASKPAFLTRQQVQQAKDEVAALDAHPFGMEWLGRRTIDYVRAHPDEPVAAESLALVVKMTRYECYRTGEYGKSPSSSVSKEAFTLLHSRYPRSDWAIKTKYYF